MNSREREDYVKYRIESAENSFKAAELLISEGFKAAAINRFYYSAFYAVNALLVANQIEAKSHKGSRTEFSRNFIKNKKIDREYGKLFSRLYDLRQTSDYDYLPDFDHKTIEELAKEVKAFLLVVLKMAQDSLR